MSRKTAHYFERFRSSGWAGTAIYLAIALVTLAVLSYLLKKSDPTSTTKGAGFVMLLYVTVGGFMVLATRIFITKRDGPK